MTPEFATILARFLIPAACGVVAAVIDVRQRKIPNAISAPLLIAGLVFRATTGGWDGFFNALAGFAVGFGLLFVLWLLRGGGGGDVKFMAAVGAWLGPWHLIAVFLLSAVLLVVFSLAMLFAKKASPQAPGGRRAIPYAVPATAAIVLWLAALLLYFRGT
jgi:prepilin peptidase CpaA